MKHPIRIAGLCFLAMLAMSVVVSTAASAAPPKPFWDQCKKTTNKGEGWYEAGCKKKLTIQNDFEKVEIEPKKTCVLSQEEIGKWKDSECKLEDVNHASKWSWITEKAKEDNFTSKQAGESVLEAKKLGKVKCKEGINAGEKTGPQHFVVNITFKGCSTEVLKISVPCGNKPLAESKEIKTSELEGTLVYALKGGVKKAAVLLTVKTKGENFAVFKCGPPGGEKTITVDGGPTQEEATAEKPVSGSCILGEINPINEMTTTGELVFKQEAGAQVLKEFEYHGKKGGVCELKSQLEKEPKEQAWENTTDEVTFEEATEINA